MSVSSLGVWKLYGNRSLWIFKKSDKDLSDNHCAAFVTVLRYVSE